MRIWLELLVMVFVAGFVWLMFWPHHKSNWHLLWVVPLICAVILVYALVGQVFFRLFNG